MGDPDGADGRGTLAAPGKFPAVSPVRFLVVVNIVCAAAAVVQSVIVARIVGAVGLAAVGVLSSLNGAVANFFDVRFSDLAAKLFYGREADDDELRQRYRQSVLQLCLLFNGALAVLMLAAGSLLGATTARLFLDQPIKWQWTVAAAAAVALAYVSNSFFFLQRLTGDFYRMGVGRLVVQALTTATLLVIVLVHRTLDGYFLALFLSAAVSALVTLPYSQYLWSRASISLLGRGVGVAGPDYRRHVRFLVSGNFFGYSKLVHRSADVLVVGAFTGDRATGLYKLARSITDFAYVLYDGLNQAYFPMLLERLGQRDTATFRRYAARIMLGAGVFTVAALAGGAAFLHPLVHLVFGPRFRGVETTILVLLVPFFFVTGVHMWVWPLLVHENQLGRFATAAMAACLVQPLVVGILCHAVAPRAVMGAWGYLAYYLALYPLTIAGLRRRRPDAVPAMADVLSW